MMDHAEGMSAALDFVIIHPGCVRENSFSLSIKDVLLMTIAQPNGMSLCGKFHCALQPREEL